MPFTILEGEEESTGALGGLLRLGRGPWGRALRS